MIYSLIREIDTSIIVKMRALNLRLKVFLLRVKYDGSFEEMVQLSEGRYLIDNEVLCKTGEGNSVFIDFIHSLGRGKYKLEGYLPQPNILKSDK